MVDKKDENYVYFLIAQNLKKQRKIKGLTQSQLAKKCSYSDGFIINIERKKYHQTFSHISSNFFLNDSSISNSFLIIFTIIPSFLLG